MWPFNRVWPLNGGPLNGGSTVIPLITKEIDIFKDTVECDSVEQP